MDMGPSQIAHLDCEMTEIAIAGQPIRLWRPLRPEAFILSTAEEEFGEDERLPYWAMLWPASIALAEYLAAMPELKGRSLLELGAGLALPGLAAARQGAVVLVTDWYMDALEYAAASARQNSLSIHCKFLDWRHPPKLPQFDYIIGADLLYERQNFPTILNTMDELLAPEGTVLLSDPDRQMSPPFFELAREQGWNIQTHPREVHWDNTDFEVNCWVMRRSEKLASSS